MTLQVTQLQVTELRGGRSAVGVVVCIAGAAPSGQIASRSGKLVSLQAAGWRIQVVGKLIFLVLAVVLVWWVLKSYRKSIMRRDPPRAAAPEDMVRCAHCGVHLPRSECHVSDEKSYCSEEHLRLHR